MNNDLCSSACAAGIVPAAATFLNSAEAADRPLKVLMIGNSFSISCLWQTPQIASACGCRLDIASLYIGGCSLATHWENVLAASDRAFRPYRFDRITEGRHVIENSAANIPDALAMDNWDVVTVQQCSHESWIPESYSPWGDNLVAEVRRRLPATDIVVQETWSYPPWDSRLGRFAEATGHASFDHSEMYARLHEAYSAFAARHGLAIIPMGTAAEFCPGRNRLFTEPDFHLSKTAGEYLQGLVWTAKLFGADVSSCGYVTDGIDASFAAELKSVAMKAVRGDYGRK